MPGALSFTKVVFHGAQLLRTLLDALLPVFLGIALGYLGGCTRELDNKQVSQLNAFVMDFAVPAAIFGTVVQASRTILYHQLPLAAILSLSMLILYLLTYVMARYGYAALPQGHPCKP